ncbi:MAG: hypothetical protein CSA33_03000 [Desulfobulbus propionicus]|nr:MAG: hypothetical protein CSA33_03000 [Desulfobulbus propionicus]
MPGETTEVWLLTDEFVLEEWTERLPGSLTLCQGTGQRKRVTWYDTYDWRLYQRGYICLATGTLWSLYDRDTGVLMKQATGIRQARRRLAGVFTGTELMPIMAAVLDARALLPLQSAQYAMMTHRVLNKDEKTVVRFVTESYTFDETEKQLELAYLVPVRGYNEEYQSVRRTLLSLRGRARCSAAISLEAAARSRGREPLDYSSKFVLSLDPDQTARSAIGTICTTLADTMRANLGGVMADLDPEFLHDFRVAVRRTRSGLTLIKKVLPKKTVTRFKDEFKNLGTVTGPVRDLDVYLLSERQYRERLPQSLQPGLTTFFEILQKDREKAQKQFIQEFRSGRVEELLAAWEKELTSEDNESAECADVPILDLAKKVIFSRYKRVLKDGRAITSECEDAKLHKLRIEGKKLRYALEFFRSLFPKEDMETAIKQLKKIQNNLGDFNDLFVQRQMLHRAMAMLKPGSRKNMEMAAALGGLMTALAQDQREVRTAFEETFRDFSHPDTVALYKRLFRE